MHRATATDFLLVAFLTLMWGSAFVLIVVALRDFSPAMIAFLRNAIAAIFVGAYAFMRGAGLPKTAHHWGYCFLLGLFGFALPFSLVPYGQEYVNSATAALLMAFSPISTLLLAHFLTHDERLDARRILGVALGFVGILVLFGGELKLENIGIGAAALLAAAFCYALSGIVMKRMSQFADLPSSAGALIAATVLCVPALALRNDFAKLGSIFDASASSLLAVAALAVGATGLAAILVLIIVRRRGATFTSTSNYGVPVVGVLLGALFLDEAIGWNILVTLCLILVAIWLARGTPKDSEKASL